MGRTEKDSLGTIEVPDHAYWGAQTQRAVENFPISGKRADPDLVKAALYVKIAAAWANRKAGVLEAAKADLIQRAAEEALAGEFDQHFVVDVYQAGAGTSFHMNVNEVIANRANELDGKRRGVYEPIHPNDHVNMGQSTNDVFPTAMRIACIFKLDGLLPEVSELAGAFQRKAGEFMPILKAGRTHLQDAAPVRLGQEFRAYASAATHARRRLGGAREGVAVLGIGGSATGTGLNTAPSYRKDVVDRLRSLTGIRELSLDDDLFHAMQSQQTVLEVSGALRGLAVELSRIANDLRLAGSGPTTGLGEITLPAVQPGSSIMPGKVNPVMAEMLNMVCFQVIGNDTSCSLACQAGQFELNVMMPLMAHNVLESAGILTTAIRAFRQKCVEGITAAPERCRRSSESTVGLATALNPIIGYAKAAEVAKEAVRTGETIPEVVQRLGIMTEAEIREKLDIAGMTGE